MADHSSEMTVATNLWPNLEPSIVTKARTLVAADLAIESVQVQLDNQHDGVIVLRGKLRLPSHQVFPSWLKQFNDLGYTPILRPDPAVANGVSLHIIPGAARKRPARAWINLVLFLVTLLSTLFVGWLYGGPVQPITTLTDLLNPISWLAGWPFALTLLGILGAHEFGHYFAARLRNVAVTLPYFIPMPFGFGTLGAFIQMREPVPDRRKLFDIGVAGPLAGLIIAIPLLFLGLATSPMQVPPTTEGAMLEGNSILYYYAKIMVFGKPLPNPVTGEDVIMNQVTFAAWIGLLVTALNLLPVGQLDGGHTVYALFGRRARYLNVITVVLMALLAVAGLEVLQVNFPQLQSIGFTGWFVWIGLILFILGPYHPPVLDEVTTLDPRRRWLGYLVIAIFIITFVPVPFRILG
jgi:membrane-associated protease RseP (regulator of RpoE activity)